jgi:hypothetical protein
MVIDSASCEKISRLVQTFVLSRVFLSDTIYVGEFSKVESFLSKPYSTSLRSPASPTVKTPPTHLAKCRMFIRECGMSEYTGSRGAVRLAFTWTLRGYTAARRANSTVHRSLLQLTVPVQPFAVESAMIKLARGVQQEKG